MRNLGKLFFSKHRLKELFKRYKSLASTECANQLTPFVFNFNTCEVKSTSRKFAQKRKEAFCFT